MHDLDRVAGLQHMRRMLPAHPQAAADEASFAWPRGPLLLIGLLILAGMTCEGVMYDWSVLYMKQELGQPQGFATLAYTSFSGAMALARLAAARSAIRPSTSRRHCRWE